MGFVHSTCMLEFMVRKYFQSLDKIYHQQGGTMEFEEECNTREMEIFQLIDHYLVRDTILFSLVMHTPSFLGLSFGGNRWSISSEIHLWKGFLKLSQFWSKLGFDIHSFNFNSFIKQLYLNSVDCFHSQFSPLSCLGISSSIAHRKCPFEGVPVVVLLVYSLELFKVINSYFPLVWCPRICIVIKNS